jgi:protein tyrosine phosphatase
MNIDSPGVDYSEDAELLRQSIALSLSLETPSKPEDSRAAVSELDATQKPTDETEREEARKKADAESRLTQSLHEGFRAVQKVKDPLSAKDYDLFLKEPFLLEAAFEQLFQDPIDSSLAFKERYKTSIAKPKLNRYLNVFACEETRIGKTIANYYLNGNVIQAKSGRKYLVTQGPLAATVEHFWQGVIHEGSRTVVSLVMPVEQKMGKCYPYWEKPVVTTADGWTITQKEKDGKVIFKKEQLTQAIVQRKFEATHKEKEKIEIVFFHYVNWPDGGIADDETFDRLLEEIKQVMGAYPVTFNCSAGCGRAGTTPIALELSLDPEANVFETVDLFRKQRCGKVVQVKEQLAMLISKKLRVIQMVTSESSSSLPVRGEREEKKNHEA